METLLGLAVIGIIVWAVRAGWRGASGGAGRSGGAGTPYRGSATDRETPDEAFATGYLVGRHLADEGSDSDDVVGDRVDRDFGSHSDSDDDWSGDDLGGGFDGEFGGHSDD